MKLLTVDSTTEICGAAVVADGRVIGEMSLNRGQTHTRTIMAVVEALLSVSNLELSAIDCFAVTRGPGSFTGLRIGVSTVKGLAAATGKPMVGVSSLEALAHQAGPGTPLVCAVMDARRSEVYWCLYRREGNRLVQLERERVGRPTDMVPHVDAACLFIGNGVRPYRDVIGIALQPFALFAGDGDHAIRPAAIARIAWGRYLEGTTEAAESFAPVYLRKSDAERSASG